MLPRSPVFHHNCGHSGLFGPENPVMHCSPACSNRRMDVVFGQRKDVLFQRAKIPTEACGPDFGECYAQSLMQAQFDFSSAVFLCHFHDFTHSHWELPAFIARS